MRNLILYCLKIIDHSEGNRNKNFEYENNVLCKYNDSQLYARATADADRCRMY